MRRLFSAIFRLFDACVRSIFGFWRFGDHVLEAFLFVLMRVLRVILRVLRDLLRSFADFAQSFAFFCGFCAGFRAASGQVLAQLRAPQNPTIVAPMASKR